MIEIPVPDAFVDGFLLSTVLLGHQLVGRLFWMMFGRFRLDSVERLLMQDCTNLQL